MTFTDLDFTNLFLFLLRFTGNRRE